MSDLRILTGNSYKFRARFYPVDWANTPNPDGMSHEVDRSRVKHPPAWMPYPDPEPRLVAYFIEVMHRRKVTKLDEPPKLEWPQVWGYTQQRVALVEANRHFELQAPNVTALSRRTPAIRAPGFRSDASDLLAAINNECENLMKSLKSISFMVRNQKDESHWEAICLEHFLVGVGQTEEKSRDELEKCLTVQMSINPDLTLVGPAPAEFQKLANGGDVNVFHVSYPNKWKVSHINDETHPTPSWDSGHDLSGTEANPGNHGPGQPAP